MGQIQTYNNMLTVIEDIATRHYQINGYMVGDKWEEGAKTNLFPMLAVNPISANMQRGQNSNYATFNVSFRLRVYDLVDKDEVNENDVQSDTLEILRDIVTEFTGHPYYTNSLFSMTEDLTFTPFTEDIDEETTGWEVTIKARTPNQRTFCGIPVTEIPGFEFPGIGSGTITGTCLCVKSLTATSPIIITETDGNYDWSFDSSALDNPPLVYVPGSADSIIPDFGSNTSTGTFSGILSGANHDIKYGSHSVILGGDNHEINNTGNLSGSGIGNLIGGGTGHLITNISKYSSILGGANNEMTSSSYSSILGGQLNDSGGFDNVHILGSSITADKANATYLQEARFDSSLNTTVISDINSGFRVESGSAVTISTDGIGTTSNFSKAWNYMSSSSNWLGMGGNGGNGTAISVQDNGVNKSATIFVDNIAVITSATNNIVTVVAPVLNTSISSNNVTLNGALYNNSVALGGTGLIVDKDDYAFVENLEVQGGNLELTAITPSTTNNALTRDADNVVRVRENASFNGFMTFTDSVTTTSLTYLDLTKNYVIFQGSDLIGSPSQISFLMYMNTSSTGGSVRIIDKTNGDALICEITGITSTSSNNIQTTTTITNIPTGPAKWAIQYHSATGATAKWRSCSIMFG